MSKNKVLWLPLTMLLVLAMVLSACGGQATTQAPAPTQAPATQAPAPTEAMAATQAPTEAMAATTEAPAMTEAPTEAMAATTAAPAASGAIDCMGAKSGDTISMLYQWSGTEEENLNKILKPLVDACGIVLKPESTRDQALLDTRVKAGTPPDIAFWNVTQLTQYKALLKPMTDLGVHAENYADYWQSIGTVDGKWLGLPVKADVKTIIWYSPTNFQALGYQVPTTWDDLNTLVDKMVADGNVPWSMGFESGDATGWSGSDFIEDILLVKQGPDFVNGIIDGSVPYNDPGVKEAYQIYGKWATDAKYTVGGAQGTLSTNFNDAIYKVFSDPPEAMMVKQSGFAGGAIAAQYPKLQYGTDYDFFQVPDAQGLQGGSDWMMAFSDSAAVKALVSYLSSTQGGQMWAQVGFDNTPNSAGTNAYTDPQLKKRAQILANAKAFVPDIGDTIPGGFGSAEWKAIVDFVNGANLDTELSNVASVQKQALSK
jgi:alpha-glucoside transport system substrate-binding protein